MSSRRVRGSIQETIQKYIPAGRIAFESPMSCVVRREAMTDCWAVGGTARLKFDFVTILEVSKDMARASIVLDVDSPYWRCLW